jgi:O-antigen/teichoic acid export membrane protein
MVAHASDAAFRPAIAAARAEGRAAALTENFGRVSRLVLTLCLPACIMLVFFAGRVSLVLGAQFVEASPVMSLIALGTLAGFLAGPAASALTMAGHSGIPFRHSVVAGAAGLGLSLTLIPRIGLLGAGVAQCTVMCLTALLDTVAARRLLGVLGVGRAHLRLLAAAAVATCAGTLASSIAPPNRYVAFLLVGSAVVAAYALALLLFGVVRWDRRTPSIAS